MNYSTAFNNLAKAINGEIDPKSLGQAEPVSTEKIVAKSENVEESLVRGTIANRYSDRLLDKKDHFPVITETQSQSSMARVLQLTSVPDWYNGTLAQIRQDVYNGILALHPNIQLNVRVPVEQAVALSDGQTNPETSKQSIKDPEDTRKKDLVPQVARPTLTSAQLVEATKAEATRKSFAGQIMKILDSQLQHMQDAKSLVERLLSSGLSAEEFDKLATFIQQDVLSELMYQGVKASNTQAEDRRRELIEKMHKNG